MKNVNKLLLIGIVLVSILFVVFGNDDFAIESAKPEEETLQNIEVPTLIPEPTPELTPEPPVSSSFVVNDLMVPPPTATTTLISKENPAILAIETPQQVDQKNFTVNITVDPNGNEIVGVEFNIKSDILQINDIEFYDADPLFSSWRIIDEKTVCITGFPASSAQKFTFAGISFTGNSGKAVIEINKIIVTNKRGNVISAKYNR